MEIKRKVGRPKKLNNTKKSRMVYISDESYAFYKYLGKGNFSEGVYKLFIRYVETEDRL